MLRFLARDSRKLCGHLDGLCFDIFSNPRPHPVQHNHDVRLLLPKHTFRLTITTASQTTGLLCIWSGTATVQAIGSSALFGDRHSAFLAGPLKFAPTSIFPLEATGAGIAALTS